ncbi:HelD family protein [Anaeromicropila herbilytica]|uniref:Helicase n=1 Tax=Anaeromicropila herbilytica TaxID=2785025 RepID=A0A7R7ICK2_9FIRM|nr:UvrD-helicase domain-containing protein [Anaeromicropila herbilytica]BCN30843.1 helicase [Anaeromicropila herbilytica]
MEYNQTEVMFEQNRLEKTMSIAKKQLDQARQKNEVNKEAILTAKKELRENTSHSIANLWSSDAFEALAELNQYANPVTEKIADYEEVENKIAVLQNIIKSPYYARIDFRFDGEDSFEPIYIGRSSLVKNNTYEMDVYDWRSPIASVFYRFVTGQAYYDAPSGRITGEVNLKRQYEINNSTLEYFFDADVQIVDEFLRKLLSQNTSTKMKTIVETIQKEQDIVIRDMENDLMMVQGVAGSGKTSIALHRAAYLMYQGLSSKLSANNIIIISPNTLFEQYISNVLPELGEENVVSVVFEDMVKKILKKESIESRNQFLENLIINPSYRNMMKSSIEYKTSFQFIDILDQFIADIPERWIQFVDVYVNDECIVKKELLKEKITGRKDTLLSLRLKQLEEYIFEQINESKKTTISKSEKAMIKQDIQKFTEINVLELYKKLFTDAEYLSSLAKDNKLPHNIKEIMEYTNDNLKSNYLHYDDAIVLAYLSIKIYGTNEYKHIKQVVIDEAQDYYPLQYEIFHLIFTNSKYTILGDMNQTLEKKEDITLYEQIQKILAKKKSSLVVMDKSFRCTNEILNYSLKFINQSPDIKSFNRKGEEPKVYVAPNQLSLKEMIINKIQSCQEFGYRSIGLICKSEKNAKALYEALKDSISLELIKNESTADLEGVFIIPVYMSKGLEFDAVLLCDADATNYHSQDDKNLLYIACTRALHSLDLFCEGEVSPLL